MRVWGIVNIWKMFVMIHKKKFREERYYKRQQDDFQWDDLWSVKKKKWDEELNRYRRVNEID